MNRITQIIADVIKAEGGYVNDPKDSGGETNWGITVEVARKNGYAGAMKDMPRGVAESIYAQRYVIDPGFDDVMDLSEYIAEELVDTGVNCGPATAGKFLQRCLNALNNEGKLWPDLLVDGGCGMKTCNALNTFLTVRGKEGEQIMLVMLNVLQGAHYINLAEARPKDENFVYGWIKNRVKLK